MRFVRLTTVDDIQKAHIIKGKLEAEGVKSFLTNTYWSTLMPSNNQLMGAGVQIMVHRDDLNIATELVDLSGNYHCPNCHSNNIEAHGLSFSQQILWFFSLILAIPPKFSLKYYCKKCGAEFKL